MGEPRWRWRWGRGRGCGRSEEDVGDTAEHADVEVGAPSAVVVGAPMYRVVRKNIDMVMKGAILSFGII